MLKILNLPSLNFEGVLAEFSTTSDQFAIDPVRGEIRSLKSFDREIQRHEPAYPIERKIKKVNKSKELLLTRRRPIKPDLADIRVGRVIAKDWRDVEPIRIAQI